MPLGSDPVLFVEAASGDATSLPISDSMLRSFVDAAFRLAGVADAGHLAVSQHAGGANFTVDVASGLFAAAGVAVANEGKYVGRNPGVYTVNCGSSPGSSLPHRLDSIVLYVRNKNTDANTIAGVAGYQAEIVLVPGTPTAGTAVAPTLPAALNSLVGPTTAAYLELAQVSRLSTELSISNSVITDVRALAVGTGDRTVGRYESATPSGTVTGSETSIGSGYALTAVVNANRRYRLVWSGETNASTAGAIPAQVSANVRVRAGTTTGATLLADKLHNIVVTGGPGQETWGFVEEIPPGTFTSGPVTLQTFLRQSAGTGSGLSMIAARMALIDCGL